MYIYQNHDWPSFVWDDESIKSLLPKIYELQGNLKGKLSTLGFSWVEEAQMKMLTEDVLKTSQIEGHILNADSVRSSVARRLGMDTEISTLPHDRHIEGIVDMLFEASAGYNEPLTHERLFGWHAALFPGGYSGIHKIHVGGYRPDDSDPMLVVSGFLGREKIHYEAPKASTLLKEMGAFLNYANLNTSTDPILKAAVAHLWFVTLHPFEDGNGRIGRAICDLLLAKAALSSKKFYTLSSQIEKDRKNYYHFLETTQKGTMNITHWLVWFLESLFKALEHSFEIIEDVLLKAQFWNKARENSLSPRQIKVLKKMLHGFDGKLTSSKWGLITNCSQDTALRDITQLLEWGVLEKSYEGGRTTHYVLAINSLL